MVLPDDIVKFAHANLQTPKTADDFDPNTHTMISATDKARIIVRKLVGAHGELFALAYKDAQTGLCTGLPLPSSAKIIHQLFFFREWVTDTTTGQHRMRHNTWKRDLKTFIDSDRYLVDHADDFLDDHADDSLDDLLDDPVDDFLEAALQEGEVALGRGDDDENMQNDEKHACDIIRNLFLGREPLDRIDEAREVAKAYEVAPS